MEMYNQGVTKGSGTNADGELIFEPDRPISGRDFAAFLARYYLHLPASSSEDPIDFLVDKNIVRAGGEVIVPINERFDQKIKFPSGGAIVLEVDTTVRTFFGRKLYRVVSFSTSRLDSSYNIP